MCLTNVSLSPSPLLSTLQKSMGKISSLFGVRIQKINKNSSNCTPEINFIVQKRVTFSENILTA